jgi:glycosyltransferase involved in cell wall biosynthesis
MHDETYTRFCRYDANGRRYAEVTSAEVRAAVERIQVKPQAVLTMQLASNQHSLSTTSNEQKLKTLALRLINSMPEGLRRPVFNFAISRRPAYQAAVRGYREGRHALRELLRPSGAGKYIALNSTKKSGTDPMYTVPFAAGDVYVSLGLDWDQKDLAYLFAQKRLVGFKALLFCYDVIPVKFPHLCVGDVASKFAKYFSDLAWCADQVLCISECSRKDLTQLLTSLGTPLPLMGIIKLGCDIQAFISDYSAPDVAELLGRSYILFVSTIERRKNHETLYRAYTRLIDSGMIDLPLLVFVGMPGWGVNDLLADLRLDPRIQPYIRILNHVSDNDLAYLYRGAYFTVYPSLYEGWGLPVAESLAYGKFCLASNAASISEVGGDLIEYLDPWDVPAWALRIKWYIENSDDLSAREQQIKNEYKPTTWLSCAASIFETAMANESK